MLDFVPFAIDFFPEPLHFVTDFVFGAFLAAAFLVKIPVSVHVFIVHNILLGIASKSVADSAITTAKFIPGQDSSEIKRFDAIQAQLQ
jgi:hypothetical protein